MANFLYFVDGLEAPPTDDRLIELGLVDRFPSGVAHVRVLDGKGPDGRGGGIICDSSASTPRYQPDEQTWHVFEANEPFMAIGWQGDKPGPNDLQRDDLRLGYPVTMGDGREWVVPTARLLPERKVFDGKEWTNKPNDEFVGLFELAERLRSEIWLPIFESINFLRTHSAGGTMRLTGAVAEEYRRLCDNRDEAMRKFDIADAITILRVNYLVDAREVSALGLFTSSEGSAVAQVFEMVNSLVDGVRLAEVESKKNGNPVPVG